MPSIESRLTWRTEISRLSEWLWGRAWLAPLAIALGPLVLVGRELLRGRALFWGTPALQFVPWWLEAIRQLSAGDLPLWNAANGMGAPLLANYQSSFFYPPNWTIFLFYHIRGTEGIAWGFTLLAMLHLVWGGWGMAAFVRRLNASRLAQVIAGTAYALSGYWIGRLEFYSMIWVGAWIPWLLRWVDEVASPVNVAAVRRRRAWLSFPLLGVMAMMLLAGHAQLSWYALELAAAWLAVGALLGDGWRGLLRAVARFATAGLAAGLIAAVQLLPTAEYLLQSQRASAVDYQQALVYSFWPWRLVSLLAPDFFGNPAVGNFWGYASYWEDYAYVGMLTLLMALDTFGRLWHNKHAAPTGGLSRAALIFWWGVMLVGLLLAFGLYTPVFPFLYRYVPGFAMFQAPARYMVWPVIALIVLAAGAIDHWHYPSGRGLYWLRLGTMGAFAVTLGAGIGWLSLSSVKLTFIRATALAGWWGLGVGGLALLARYREQPLGRRVWSALVYVWLLADLLVAGWNLNPTVPLSFYADSSQQTARQQAEVDGGRIYLSASDEYFLKFDRFFRFQDFRAYENWQGVTQVLLPNTNLYSGLQLVDNFDPLVPGRFAAWIDVLDRLPENRRTPLLKMMDVRLVEQLDGRAWSGVRFDVLEGSFAAAIYPCAQQLPAEANPLVWMAHRGYGLLTLLVEADQSLGLPACVGQLPQTLDVQAVAPGLSRVDLPGATKGGWLFVSQVWYPGWQAWVDGVRTPIYRANSLFMAVQLPAGAQQVTLEYQPLSFRLGALLSILILVILLVYWLIHCNGSARHKVADQPGARE